MAHWYTADPHFGHEAILAHAERPFRSIEHMDATLIERMWSRVGPEDDLWIVGDFAFGECLNLCVSDLAHAVFRYVQASKRPLNIMAS
jgi:calcineurin-like phosphoesterase family protein